MPARTDRQSPSGHSPQEAAKVVAIQVAPYPQPDLGHGRHETCAELRISVAQRPTRWSGPGAVLRSAHLPRSTNRSNTGVWESAVAACATQNVVGPPIQGTSANGSDL